MAYDDIVEISLKNLNLLLKQFVLIVIKQPVEKIKDKIVKNVYNDIDYVSISMFDHIISTDIFTKGSYSITKYMTNKEVE